MAEDVIRIKVKLNDQESTVLRFWPEVYQRHAARARAEGVALEDCLARKISAAGVVDGPVLQEGPDPESPE
jgi:hypothetical protein